MKKHGLNEAQLRRRACQEKVLPKQIKVALKLICEYNRESSRKC